MVSPQYSKLVTLIPAGKTLARSLVFLRVPNREGRGEKGGSGVSEESKEKGGREEEKGEKVERLKSH